MSCSNTEAGSEALTTTRGDTFGFKLRLWQDLEKTIPADLSSAIVAAQLRQTPDSEEIEATFATEISGHEITLTLLPTQTAVLPQRCVWDIQIDWEGDATSIQTVARGTLTVGPDVTR